MQSRNTAGFAFLKLSFEQTYPETFAEQCKYREKERKTINFIDKEIG